MKRSILIDFLTLIGLLPTERPTEVDREILVYSGRHSAYRHLIWRTKEERKRDERDAESLFKNF